MVGMLLMREMQSSAWLRSVELLRPFRLSSSLRRDCSTAFQEDVSSSWAMWIRARFLVLLSIFSSRSRHIFIWPSAATCSSISFTFSA